MDEKAHWESIYRTKSPAEVSWFQSESRVSLELIRRAEPRLYASIIDVGGGASVLVDNLLSAGYRKLTVLDLSAAALELSRLRIGIAGDEVTWQVANILTSDLPVGTIDLWHDRAVFHFLTNPLDRERYVAKVRRAVRPGGHVLIATFAEDGPTRCSGLEVARYKAESLHSVFGSDFELLEQVREEHLTPWGARQSFVYCLCCFDPKQSAKSME